MSSTSAATSAGRLRSLPIAGSPDQSSRSSAIARSITALTAVRSSGSAQSEATRIDMLSEAGPPPSSRKRRVRR